METEHASTKAPPHQTRPFLAPPCSRLGWCSVGLAGICVLILVTMLSGMLNRLVERRTIAGFGSAMVLSGIAAGVTSLLAMVFHRERSWLVVLSLLFGAAFLFLIINEMLLHPH